jgi:hypothetical protein
LLISVLIGLTATRALAMAFIPKVAMFGGAAPDAWVGPWVADSVLGLLIPLVLFTLHRIRAARAWGLILLYNGIGAFDYIMGLVTQWQSPLPPSIAPTLLVYGSLSFTLVAQLAVIVLLLRRDVVKDFTEAT